MEQLFVGRLWRGHLTTNHWKSRRNENKGVDDKIPAKSIPAGLSSPAAKTFWEDNADLSDGGSIASSWQDDNWITSSHSPTGALWQYPPPPPPFVFSTSLFCLLNGSIFEGIGVWNTEGRESAWSLWLISLLTIRTWIQPWLWTVTSASIAASAR